MEGDHKMAKLLVQVWQVQLIIILMELYWDPFIIITVHIKLDKFKRKDRKEDNYRMKFLTKN